MLPLEAFQDKGCVTWTVDGASRGGMYLYLVEVEEDLPYATPLGTAEGILDWKDIAWILHPENKGIAHNVPYFLPFLLEEEAAYEHCCYFTGDSLTEVVSSRLEPAAGQ
ncbi:hypothetical protein N6H14_07930 [Paenibacillus sp. CC-CFT747]|nr:hypothetical protein N6H14_07930 [Paenibacillus sp. CC-CFT747]